MIGLFWNIRGLVLIGRVPALTSRIRENHVDFVGVLEKKNMFTQGFLRSLTGSVPFNWFYQPAVGAASGILVGVNDDLYVATLSQILRFLVSIMVMDKKKLFLTGSWWLSMVLHVKMENRSLLMNSSVVAAWQGPTI
jgi:hypothetical protein